MKMRRMILFIRQNYSMLKPYKLVWINSSKDYKNLGWMHVVSSLVWLPDQWLYCGSYRRWHAYTLHDLRSKQTVQLL